MLATRVADPTMLHERCIRCAHVPLPHTHRIPKTAGGIAVLERDDFTDNAYLEEALWVSFELALTDWYQDPTVLPLLTSEAGRLRSFVTTQHRSQPLPWHLAGLGMTAEFDINLGEHMEDEVNAIEVTCTLTEFLA
jgi:hypothetical protein